MPWPEFVALVHRAGRYPAREMLLQIDATAAAIGTAFGGGKDGEAAAARRKLEAVAYPEDPKAAEAKVEHLKKLEAEQDGAS